jgi:hypothetical protein
MRETGWSLSGVGVRSLRRVVPSKKLLLHRVICDENPANNDEILIYSCPLITIDTLVCGYGTIT